ncbi:MAG: molybdopterin-dependent oxidoreductase [Deltaproteobacteria bacterium]|nr:molybdopterin-dependent oxidoreductase [Deltaproteobacteria bacterium]
MYQSGITRRKFLVGSAAGGASLFAASYLGFDARAAEKKVSQEIKITPTLCDACGNWCAINVYTKGGGVWKAEGNPIAGNNKGRICAKGHAMLREVHNPDRIKSPLKRVAPGKFEPISWEQAYKEIGEKLRDITEKHGPASLFWLQYPEGNADLTYLFMRALGSPNVFSHGATCFLPRNIGWWLTSGKAKPEHDFENSRFVLFIGRNPAAGLQLRQLQDLAKAADKGARLVVVDPRYSEAAVLGHHWIRIRPGTDLALLLAMAHVMITEGIFQKDFVNNYTEGFEEWAEKIKDCTPAWAEEITSIPKEVIVKLAGDMAREAPRAVIHRGYHGAMGTQYKNSLQLVRAVACVNGLLGNYNQLGGLYFPPDVKLGKLDPQKYPEPPKVDGPMVDGSTDSERYPLTPKGIGISQAIPELALNGKLKAGFVYHNNPLRTNANPARVIEGYRNLELLVSFDYVLSETASLSHYILPESYYLERDDVVHTNHCYSSKQVAIRQQVVKPLFDTKPLFQILAEMAPHLGIGQYFNFTLEEYNRASLAPLGVTLERLNKEGVIDLGGEWRPGEPKFATPSGKLEFASSILRDLGLPVVPEWEEPLVMPDKNDLHSFRLIHGKQGHHTHARTINQPYLKEITMINDWGRVWIHPDRARVLGIKDGDCMTISSSVGKGRARARVTEGIHTDCIFLPSGYGVFARKLQTGYGYGVSYNDFLPTYFDPVLGHNMSSEIIVRVERT